MALLRKYHQVIGAALHKKCMSWVSLGGINESKWRQACANLSTYAVWLLPLRRRPGRYQEQHSSFSTLLLGVCCSVELQPTGSLPSSGLTRAELGCFVQDLPEAPGRDGCMLNQVCCPEGEHGSGWSPLPDSCPPFVPMAHTWCTCSLYWAPSSAC